MWKLFDQTLKITHIFWKCSRCELCKWNTLLYSPTMSDRIKPLKSSQNEVNAVSLGVWMGAFHDGLPSRRRSLIEFGRRFPSDGEHFYVKFSVSGFELPVERTMNMDRIGKFTSRHWLLLCLKKMDPLAFSTVSSETTTRCKVSSDPLSKLSAQISLTLSHIQIACHYLVNIHLKPLNSCIISRTFAPRLQDRIFVSWAYWGRPLSLILAQFMLLTNFFRYEARSWLT